jgi:hypothetical protein
MDGFRALEYIDARFCDLVSRKGNPYKSVEGLRGALGQAAAQRGARWRNHGSPS